MDEMVVVAGCPALQLVTLQIGILVSPVRVMAIEVSNQNGGVLEVKH
jgi:hypothetical protein